MSAVESQEDFDVVEAISLGGKHERRGGCESAKINTNMKSYEKKKKSLFPTFKWGGGEEGVVGGAGLPASASRCLRGPL